MGLKYHCETQLIMNHCRSYFITSYYTVNLPFWPCTIVGFTKMSGGQLDPFSHPFEKIWGLYGGIQIHSPLGNQDPSSNFQVTFSLLGSTCEGKIVILLIKL